MFLVLATSTYQVPGITRTLLLFYVPEILPCSLMRTTTDFRISQYSSTIFHHSFFFFSVVAKHSTLFITRRTSEASLFFLGFPRKKKPLHNGSYEHRVPKMKKQNILLYRVCVWLCVIQHRNWPLGSTILNAHGKNASPDGLWTRTHTNEAFSCCFCRNSFRVDRVRRGILCLEDQAKACSPTDQPVRKFEDGLGTNMAMKNFFTFRTEWYFGTPKAVQACSGVPAAWCRQRRLRLMPSRTHSSNLHVI